MVRAPSLLHNSLKESWPKGCWCRISISEQGFIIDFWIPGRRGFERGVGADLSRRSKPKAVVLLRYGRRSNALWK